MSFIKNWLRTEIQELQAYPVANSEGLIKLDAMESPFKVPDNLKEDWLNYCKNIEINRYPDTESINLKNTLKTLMDIPNDLDILLGNGSDELIQLLALACKNDDYLMSFKPSFVMYEVIAKLAHLNFTSIPLTNNFEIDLEKTLKIIQEKQPKIIFIAYPNNPTGNCFDKKSIETIINTTTALVVLDEAYYAYTQNSFINKIKNYDNLIVMRTISKVGFAGIRLGLLIAKTELIQSLNKLRMPYNINSLTQKTAEFLLTKNYIKTNIQIIIKERKFVFNALKKYQDLIVFPTQTNFILFKVNNADELFNFLKTNHLLIKNLNSSMQGFLRVTIGTPKENKIFLDLIKKYYDNKH
ncbi:Histidinol-phosphate aminotransferase [hydrothermal vent metagenome]|uniref:histidinol-phosphate transaminase n=1 Tax=hydrothermal vent metagenome TaxID=652676 RepID=A0A1W1CMX9_9ZZZZ